MTAALSLAALSFFVSSSAAAQGEQVESRLEIGAAQIQQPGREARSALVLGGLRHHADSAMAAYIGGTITWARDSVAAAQAVAAVAWRPSPQSRWQLEAGGAGAAFALSQIGSAGNVSGWSRARYALSRNVGVLAGATAGYTVRGSEESPSTALEAGAWATAGPLVVELTAARARTRDSLLMAASRVYGKPGIGWLDVGDVALSASWGVGQLALELAQRWRTGLAGTDAAQAASSGAATWTMTSRTALVATVGRQLADPARGAPDATVASAVFRLTFGAGGPATPAGSEAAVTPMERGANLVVRIRAPIGARVEVAGSFSNWDPVPLDLRNGVWEARITVAPGRYRVAYRIDGGPWRAPGGLARLREFGGEVGLIVIP
ncbi:MAG: glycogen-binding domain-containing protein [Gemmatimonadaceae bacterium]|nr:glycogen-binding domain-containing protein [Gemmatimonadaceae bacterium]